MATIKPYKIAVPDSALETLHTKLTHATFPNPVDFSDNWDYGSPLTDVRRLSERWRDGYDWRKHEKQLNDELPQFTTRVPVDGFGELGIHFVHKRGKREDSIPLLFVHGWPGSFLEVIKILPLLTNPEGDAPSFHVVAPSLPNYGFSDEVTKGAFAIRHYSTALHQVMLNLGYDKYVTQGGDWGFAVTRMIGYQFPKHCVASHLNFVRISTAPSITQHPIAAIQHALKPYSEADRAGLERSAWFDWEGYGYNHEQSTKPSTLGFALADSPLALLAWIYEKLHDWTDSYPWTDDEILTWVSIYQFSTAGPAANVRIYYENRHAGGDLQLKESGYIPSVKLGLSCFPRDLVVPPKGWGVQLGPVVFERYHADGGHFAAHERPQQLANDLREMFGPGGGAYREAQNTIKQS
ncbi:alpha/beta-hydrolase [Sarocladium strictum]